MAPNQGSKKGKQIGNATNNSKTFENRVILLWLDSRTFANYQSKLKKRENNLFGKKREWHPIRDLKIVTSWQPELASVENYAMDSNVAENVVNEFLLHTKIAVF